MKYKILEYIDSTHTIVVRYNDDENLTFNFDLAVKPDSSLPSNEEIDRLILNAAPLSRAERVSIVKQTEAVRLAALVGQEKEFGVVDVVTPPPLPPPDPMEPSDLLTTTIVNSEKINSIVI